MNFEDMRTATSIVSLLLTEATLKLPIKENPYSFCELLPSSLEFFGVL